MKTTHIYMHKRLPPTVQRSSELSLICNVPHIDLVIGIVRGAASSVSGRPGSQTIRHAAQNIREEVGQSTADLAKSIAGGNVFVDNVEPTQHTFVSVLA